MKSKVRIILTALFVAFAFFAVQAQRGQQQQLTPEQRADRQTAMMTEKLSLTKEQADKIKAINLKYTEKQKAQRAENKGDREKNRTAMQQLQDDRKAEINAVLNKEQQAKFEKMQEERGDTWQGKPGPGKGNRSDKAERAPDPDKQAERMTQHMTEKLALTNDQAAKVKNINLDFAKQRQSLRAESPKGQRPDAAAMEKLRKQHEDQLKKVLTEDQFKKWEQMDKENEGGGGKGKMRQKGKGM